MRLRIRMAKVAAMEEMYLIYQAFINYLAGIESWGDFERAELMASYRSFCQREPIRGMFWESVVEEMLDRVKDGEARMERQGWRGKDGEAM
jgi:hypothetical protein